MAKFKAKILFSKLKVENVLKLFLHISIGVVDDQIRCHWY